MTKTGLFSKLDHRRLLNLIEFKFECFQEQITFFVKPLAFSFDEFFVPIWELSDVDCQPERNLLCHANFKFAFFPCRFRVLYMEWCFFYRPSVICGDINRIHEPLRSSKVFWLELEIFITHFDSFFTLLFGKAIKVKLVVVKVIF